MSDLEQIVDGVEPSEEVIQEPVEQEAEQPEAVAEPAQEAQQPEPKAEQTVPLAALLEVRQELQALKTLATPKQEPVAAPDVFEDPQGYSKHMAQQMEQVTRSTKLEMSRFMAEREFGADKVTDMMAYFDQNPDQSTAFLGAASPFHAAMDHYNKQRVAQEIGDDPVKYREKIEAEVRAKLEAEMVAKQARDAAGKYAPSMANVTGTGGGPKSSWTGPTDLSQAIGE